MRGLHFSAYMRQPAQDVREERNSLLVESLVRDVFLAVRTIWKNPGFASIAILTLALGIGSTTAIFTLVQQVMLKPLPVREPNQLWRFGSALECCNSRGYAQNDWNFFPWEAFKLFRAKNSGFEELAAFQLGNTALGVRRQDWPSETANGEFVSGNFFKTLGISAWRGRVFTDDDDQKGAPAVAVMSFRAWREKYGADPSIPGATYNINGHPFTIIGIGPPGFIGAKVADSGMPDFWMPLTTEPLLQETASRLESPRTAWLDLIGRVRPDTNVKALEAQLQVELHGWLASHVADMTPQEKRVREKQTLHLTPGGAGVSLIRAHYKDALLLLFLASISVLLVGCANVANLLLVRALTNRDQIALRAALGASRVRLVQTALVESLVLAVFGALGGLVIAYSGASLIIHLAFTQPNTSVPVNAAPSLPVLLFALGLSVLTGQFFGIAPAWMTSHANPIEALRGVNRSAGGGRHRAKKLLVIVQSILSLVLLSMAAMLGQSLNNLENQNFGFDLRGRYLVTINTMLSSYKQEQLVPTFGEIEDRLRSIPGVRKASASLYAPMSRFDWEHEIRIAGKPEPGPRDDLSSGWTRIMPGSFETLGVNILMGRSISDSDNDTTRRVAVVNEAFVKRFFGKENPLGQHFGPAPLKNSDTYEIVGVVPDVRYFLDIGDPVRPMYFVPEAQAAHFDEPSLQSRENWSHFPYNIVIWAPGNPPNLEGQVRKELSNFNIPIYNFESYPEVINEDFAQQNMVASLAWLFGSLALVLAAVGLYGLTAYSVAQRTREIGVRMALGAQRGSVVLLVVREALLYVTIGLALGIPAAIAAGQLMTSQLYDVKPWDPRMLLVAAMLLVLAALISASIPANRATKVDPVAALR